MRIEVLDGIVEEIDAQTCRLLWAVLCQLVCKKSGLVLNQDPIWPQMPWAANDVAVEMHFAEDNFLLHA